MTIENMNLLNEAQKAKILYNLGAITREEAKDKIMPYIKKYNTLSTEIAKKYNMKPKKISFVTFVR